MPIKFADGEYLLGDREPRQFQYTVTIRGGELVDFNPKSTWLKQSVIWMLTSGQTSLDDDNKPTQWVLMHKPKAEAEAKTKPKLKAQFEAKPKVEQ